MNAKNKGFTLIELLVVIAIIAMLLAIVMPTMNKAKMYAEEVMCKSNIHQYHIATETYSLENKEYYPNPWVSLFNSCQGRCGGGFCQQPEGTHASFPTEIQRYCRWHNDAFSREAHPEFAGPYWPYLAQTKASVCPTFSKIAPRYGASHPLHVSSIPIGQVQFAYSMNSMFHRRTTTNPSMVLPVRRGQVRSPFQTFLWAEENMWSLD